MKKLLLYLMALLYAGAGINHFMNAEQYVSIMPPWIPFKLSLVYITGLFEFVLGLMLMQTKTRKIAAIGIIVLLVVVFPANVQMMINYRKVGHPHFWLAVLRLPLQALLIWWAYTYTQQDKLHFKSH